MTSDMKFVSCHMRVNAKRFRLHPVYDEMSDKPVIMETHAMMCESAATAIEQRDRLIAALTPDGDTKAAYMGEIYDANHKNRPVSWTAIKAVMAMIRKEAGCE